MIRIENCDALDVEADAILFSTNERLYLTGGFGAALIDRFGQEIQERLLDCLRTDDRRFADTGEVFAFSHSPCPWKLLFAAVAVDPMYSSSPDVVAKILSETFSFCSARHDIRRLVTTALATGYGDMTIEAFIELLVSEADSFDHPFELVLAHPDPSAFKECLDALSAINAERTLGS